MEVVDCVYDIPLHESIQSLLSMDVAREQVSPTLTCTCQCHIHVNVNVLDLYRCMYLYLQPALLCICAYTHVFASPINRC